MPGIQVGAETMHKSPAGVFEVMVIVRRAITCMQMCAGV